MNKRMDWRRNGQAAILMCLSLTFLFGCLGFAVDLGNAYYQKQSAQAAADSAAIAAVVYAKNNGSTCGSGGVVCNSTPQDCTHYTTGAFHAGCQYASQNGFTSTSTFMSGNTGTPPGAPGTSPTYWVTATISNTSSSRFFHLSGATSVTVAATATAGVVGGGSGTGNCILVLDPSGSQALFVTGQANITLTSCTMQVNSSADGTQPSQVAASVNGQGMVSGRVNVKGGSMSGNQVHCANPPFFCGAATLADPLASVPEPSLSGLTNYNCPGTSGYTISQGTVTIPSGVYCGGIHISGGNVTFATGGTFVMKDGGLIIDNGTTTGTNVMFYLTSSNHNTTTDPLITINTSSITLSAPSSGTYRGILFFGDRNAPVDSISNFNSLQAAATPNITGTFYFKKGNFKMSGQGGLNGYAALIAYRVSLDGQATFKWDGTGAYTGLAPGAVTYLLQ